MASPVRIVFEFHTPGTDAGSVITEFNYSARQRAETVLDHLKCHFVPSGDKDRLAIVALCSDGQSVRELADMTDAFLTELPDSASLVGIRVFGQPTAETTQELLESWAAKRRVSSPGSAGGEPPVTYRGYRIRPRLYRAPAGNSWLAGEFTIEHGDGNAADSVEYSDEARFCQTHDEAWEVTVEYAKSVIDRGELEF